MKLDWKLLRAQKLALLEYASNGCYITQDTIDGVVNLIDFVQDYAVGTGDATKEQVFGRENQLYARIRRDHMMVIHPDDSYEEALARATDIVSLWRGRGDALSVAIDVVDENGVVVNEAGWAV